MSGSLPTCPSSSTAPLRPLIPMRSNYAPSRVSPWITLGTCSSRRWRTSPLSTRKKSRCSTPWSNGWWASPICSLGSRLREVRRLVMPPVSSVPNRKHWREQVRSSIKMRTVSAFSAGLSMTSKCNTGRRNASSACRGRVDRRRWI